MDAREHEYEPASGFPMIQPEIPRRAFLSALPAASGMLAGLAATGANASTTESESPHENFIPPNVQPPAVQPFPEVFASCAIETVYLVRCGDKSVLVDTGFLHNTDAHLDNFAAAGVDLNSIAAIFASHPHVDHVAGLAQARERLGCPVVAHKNAVRIIESGDRVLSAAYMPFVGWDFPFPPCKVDHAVEDGDTIEVGERTFTAFHTPGHTPGCVSYFWVGKLISGDILYADGTFGWMDAYWGSNYQDLLETFDRFDKIAPQSLLPTHGLPYAFDASITAKARARINRIFEEKVGGVLRQTKRAERRDPQSTARHLKF